MDVLQHRSPAVVVAAGLGSLYILYLFVQATITSHRRYLLSRKHGCKPVPSYPHKDPIFGLDVFVKNYKLSNTGGFLDDVKRKYEKVIGGYTFTQLVLGERVILTAEPENIKAILATQFKDFELPPRRKVAFQPVFGHGIFTTDGGEWETSRALLRPNFSRSQVGDLDTFEVHISNMISKIPRDGSTVDLQALFFKLTMDSATDFLFGYSTNVLGSSGNSEAGQRFTDAFSYVTFKVGIEARIGRLVTIIPDKKYQEGVKFIHQYVANYVQKAMSLHQQNLKDGKLGEDDEKAGKYVFLEHLAKTDYSERKIQDELLNILLAGRDTTASLLGYFFYILARRPDVMEKLREEISKLGNTRPSFEEIKSLKYLQHCLNETLRLHPIVPMNSRVAVRDTTIPLGGGPDGKSPVLVKKGQSVNYAAYVMQRRTDIYGEDALEFKPERWEKLRPSWQYLPFNGGPRICIGQQFALTEASYTVIRLLQSFSSIEKRDDSELLEYLTLTAAVRGGVNVGLTPA
ncbi:Cytochrome P450 monooxygenase [Lachnellula subtilissima]|uniref:Cytochrome P450 monooxygenase n=1 Tax=Lachnellula subtilissima TaxID=602034 RepID=A0A8H8U9E4_9HELO|nr:Cytochrome P450 monooxygenase [Lachnellula subtilissima]